MSTNLLNITGGFYEHQVTTNLSLISLNTNLWYKSNHYTSDMADPGEMLAWVDSILDNIQQRNGTAWIIGHIPAGKFERFNQECGEYKGCDTHGGYLGFHWLTEDFNKKYIYVWFLTVESFLLTLKHSSRYISIIQKFNSPHLDNWFWNGTFEDDPWEDIVDQLADFKPTISAQLFAHHHTDSVKIFQSKPHGLLGWQLPISAAFLVPGVSPMRFVVK